MDNITLCERLRFTCSKNSCHFSLTILLSLLLVLLWIAFIGFPAAPVYRKP